MEIEAPLERAEVLEKQNVEPLGHTPIKEKQDIDLPVSSENEDIDSDATEDAPQSSDGSSTESDADFDYRKEKTGKSAPEKKRRRRTTVGGGSSSSTAELTEYEKIRLATIARNRKVLESLKFNEITAEMNSLASSESTPKKRRAPGTGQPKRARKVEEPAPRRSSGRVRNTTAGPGLVDSDDEPKPKVEEATFLTPEEYFAKNNIEIITKTDGNYKGWVEEEVRMRLGIAENAAAAWDSNGGGTFSYKEANSVKKAGMSNAKAFSSTQLKKNPNSYFYRNTEPGVDQWMGEWTEEEHEKFIEVASKYGCGDKWGLFSTYIPHRVGYQCSNYYRSDILRCGIVDPNYIFAANGVAHYVGKKGSRGGKDE